MGRGREGRRRRVLHERWWRGNTKTLNWLRPSSGWEFPTGARSPCYSFAYLTSSWWCLWKVVYVVTGKAKKFFLLLFQQDQPDIPGLCSQGLLKSLLPLECKGGRRLIAQNTIARKVLLSSWESVVFLSPSTWLPWFCIASGKQLWAHTVKHELFPSFSTAVVLLEVSCIVCVTANLGQNP